MGKASRKKKRTEPISYYHGGFAGLVPGGLILPSTETSITLRGGYSLFDPRRVFVTTSLDLATAYALQFARKATEHVPGYTGPALGAVYEVRVKGPKTADEDFAELAPTWGGHFSFSVLVPPEITRVVAAGLPPDPQREYRLLAPYETWESPDGKIYPMWSPAGFMLPNPKDAKKGLTWQLIEDHHQMGPFPGKDILIEKGFYKN